MKMIVLAAAIFVAAVCADEAKPAAPAAETVFQENFEEGTVGAIQRVPAVDDTKSPSVPPVDKNSKWVGLIEGVDKVGYTRVVGGLKTGDKVVLTLEAINDRADGDPRGFVVNAFVKKADGSHSRRQDVTTQSKGKWETVKLALTMKEDEASIFLVFANGFKQDKTYVDNIVITVERAK